MNSQLGVALICLLGLSAPAWSADPVYTREAQFRIPYHADPAELARLNAREVRLYVSDDRGATWELWQNVSPMSGRFAYEAPADGEYWFAVRTVDQQGRMVPASDGELRAGLVVRVDTTKPSFIVSLNRRNDQVDLAWEIKDADLDLNSLLLEVRQGNDTTWKPIQVRSTVQGQTSWRAPNTGNVTVRGSVKDRAGNTAQSSANLVIKETGYSPLPARPELEGPIADEARPQGSVVQVADTQETPVDQETKGENRTRGVPGTLVSQTETIIPFDNRKPVEAPTDAPDDRLAMADDEAISDGEAIVEDEPYVDSATTDFGTEDSPPEDMAPQGVNSDGFSEPETTPIQDDFGEPLPPAETEPATNQEETVEEIAPVDEPPAAPDTPAVASDAEDGAKIVRVREFNLGYEIESVGPSGVGLVEFFITEDNGKTWFRYGTDDDRESPFGIRVPREGRYGFLMRVRSGVGLGGNAPRPGDEPDFSVVVDQTPPEIRLSPTAQQPGGEQAVVRLQWQMTDAYPESRKSVDLAYSSQPDGPWTDIATGIDNSGVYDWTTGDITAGRVYLRVTARDAAGNVGEAISGEPVIVDFTEPTARITDVAVHTGS